MNQKCHARIQMSHITYERVTNIISHVTIITHINESCHESDSFICAAVHSNETWVMSRISSVMSRISHIWMSREYHQSCHDHHTYEWVVSRTWLLHMCCDAFKWNMSHIIRHVTNITHINESCHEHKYKWVTPSYVLRCIPMKHESCHMTVSRTSHINESSHEHYTYKWVMSRTSSYVLRCIQMKHESCHVTHVTIITHINESCHEYDSFICAAMHSNETYFMSQTSHI